MPALNWPRLGFGVGLRADHYEHVLSQRPAVDWFEALTENYLDSSGRPLHVLEQVRRDYPVVLHGVALSIGSTDSLDSRYLRKLRALIERIEPALVTDHLCWTGVAGYRLYDLLPLPYTPETLAHVVDRVRRAQDVIGRRLVLENPSAYLAFRHSVMSEWEFLGALAEAADCGLLLDVNNVYVSAHNLGFDPYRYLDRIPPDRVAQVHLAGFSDMGSYLFDTHSAPVHEDVWALYRYAVARLGIRATLVEWDADIPPFERLHAEAERARRHAAEATTVAHTHDQRVKTRTVLASAPTVGGSADRASGARGLPPTGAGAGPVAAAPHRSQCQRTLSRARCRISGASP